MNEEQQKKNIVCQCVQVSEYDIRKAIRSGMTSFEALRQGLQVASTCKFCAVDVAKILNSELSGEN